MCLASLVGQRIQEYVWRRTSIIILLAAVTIWALSCATKIRIAKNKLPVYLLAGVRGGAFGRGIALHARRSRFRFPMWSLTSGRSIALESIRPVKETSIKDIFWGRYVRRTTLPFTCAECLGILEASNSFVPQGPVQACTGKLTYSFSKIVPRKRSLT